MKQPPIQKRGLAIDWETSGFSVPDYTTNHQGISFGAIIFDLTTFEEIDSLYCEIQFDESRYTWADRAEKVHGITRAHLKEFGMSQEDAALQLASLVLKYLGTDGIVLLGHRVYFDEAFTNQLMNSIDVQFSYDPIRIDSAAIGLTFLHLTSSDMIFDTMGFEPRKDHNALEDIRMTLGSIRMLKQLMFPV